MKLWRLGRPAANDGNRPLGEDLSFRTHRRTRFRLGDARILASHCCCILRNFQCRWDSAADSLVNPDIVEATSRSVIPSATLQSDKSSRIQRCEARHRWRRFYPAIGTLRRTVALWFPAGRHEGQMWTCVATLSAARIPSRDGRVLATPGVETRTMTPEAASRASRGDGRTEPGL